MSPADVEALQARVAELEEEVVYWKGEVELEIADTAVERLAAELRGGANRPGFRGAWMLLRLYRAGSRGVSVTSLLDDCPGWIRRGGSDHIKSVSVYVMRLRQVFGKEAFQNLYGRYLLTPFGRDRVQPVLARCGLA